MSEHTTDKYVILANQRLTDEGYDVEGASASQGAFQVRPYSAPRWPVLRIKSFDEEC